MKKPVLLCIIISAMLAAGHLWAKTPESAEYEPGKRLYNNRCQICHGMEGNGKRPAAASFSPRPTDFTNPAFWKDNVNKKIADSIQKGYGMMPAFDLKPDQVNEIIRYMSHAFKRGEK